VPDAAPFSALHAAKAAAKMLTPNQFIARHIVLSPVPARAARASQSGNGGDGVAFRASRKERVT
jgi:hypothetical protein